MASDIFNDIIRATCGNRPQREKDYLYESMVMLYNDSKEEREHGNEEND